MVGDDGKRDAGATKLGGGAQADLGSSLRSPVLQLEGSSRDKSEGGKSSEDGLREHLRWSGLLGDEEGDNEEEGNETTIEGLFWWFRRLPRRREEENET